MTLNTIVNELKNVPIHRLEEVYVYVSSLSRKPKKADEAKVREIMSYAGSIGDMSNKDFKGYIRETRRVRKKLFNRNVKV